jgi:hypothetical protein
VRKVTEGNVVSRSRIRKIRSSNIQAQQDLYDVFYMSTEEAQHALEPYGFWLSAMSGAPKHKGRFACRNSPAMSSPAAAYTFVDTSKFCRQAISLRSSGFDMRSAQHRPNQCGFEGMWPAVMIGFFVVRQRLEI